MSSTLSSNIGAGSVSGYKRCALFRSVVRFDKSRAKTDSAVTDSVVPLSMAASMLHFPVPFCPARSAILSIRDLPSVSLYRNMGAVPNRRARSMSSRESRRRDAQLCFVKRVIFLF